MVFYDRWSSKDMKKETGFDGHQGLGRGLLSPRNPFIFRKKKKSSLAMDITLKMEFIHFVIEMNYSFLNKKKTAVSYAHNVKLECWRPKSKNLYLPSFPFASLIINLWLNNKQNIFQLFPNIYLFFLLQNDSFPFTLNLMGNVRSWLSM